VEFLRASEVTVMGVAGEGTIKAVVKNGVGN